MATQSTRQSVTIPPALHTEVERIAHEKNLTMSRALVFLAERGAKAERDAKADLMRAYRRLMKEKDPQKQEQAGDDLIRAIFGPDAVA
jgi:hypothetical protein